MLPLTLLPESPSEVLTEVRKSMRAGDFSCCHEMLDTLPNDPCTTLLRSRVLIREAKHAAAIQHLLEVESQVQDGDRALWCTLLGAAHAYSGQFADAQAHFERAAALPSDDDVHLDLVYYRGTLARLLRDYDAALSAAAVLEASDEHTYRGLGFTLHSWVEVNRGNAQGQSKLLVRALDAFEKSRERDEYLVGRTLMTLGALCRDTFLASATKRLKSSAERVRWGSSLALDHFQVTRFLASIEALAGNELAAFRLLKLSASLAPSNVWKVLPLLDRAKLARSNGEESFALDQLYEAHALASEVNWVETHNEERCALLILGELFASTDPRIATQYLEKFHALPPVDANLAYASDRRVSAFAAYSAGMAHKQLGNGSVALAALTDAWDTFEEFAYGWRSALAAAAIYELTGARTWLTRAQHAIAPWPNSWIARKVVRLDAEKPPTAKLTSMQHRIYDSLLAGHSTKEIAEKLGRSPNTIRNHIASVFLAFRVKSRAQLLSTSFALSNVRSAEQAYTQASA